MLEASPWAMEEEAQSQTPSWPQQAERPVGRPSKERDPVGRLKGSAKKKMKAMPA